MFTKQLSKNVKTTSRQARNICWEGGRCRKRNISWERGEIATGVKQK